MDHNLFLKNPIILFFFLGKQPDFSSVSKRTGNYQHDHILFNSEEAISSGKERLIYSCGLSEVCALEQLFYSSKLVDLFVGVQSWWTCLLDFTVGEFVKVTMILL